jgi:hypothetical protein
MTPENRVREFWEQRGTPLSVASITELVRGAENAALERAASIEPEPDIKDGSRDAYASGYREGFLDCLARYRGAVRAMKHV